MKNIILFAALLISMHSFAQMDTLPVNPDTHLVDFTEVVKVDSATAKVLYSNAKLYMANAFVSGKAATQLNDDENFTIVGNGYISVGVSTMLGKKPCGGFDFKVTIQCKDGRYRYSFTGFNHSASGGDACGPIEKAKSGNFDVTKKDWNNWKDMVRSQINTTIVDLKKYMEGSVAATKGNW